MSPRRIENLQHHALQRIVHRFSRLRRDRIITGDVEMPYVFAGTGEPIVFLHGFADQKETWSLVGRVLSARYRVIAPDMPGFGVASAVPASHTGTRALARYIVRFLDALELERVHLVGNSMGGGVAQRLAHSYRHRVQSLTLIASMGPNILRSAFDRALQTGAPNPLIPTSIDQYLKMMEWVFERPPPIPAVVLRHMARRQVERAEDFEAYFQILVREWDWDTVGIATQPTLVIQGSRDRIIHPATARALVEELPNARLMMMSGTGHAPQWERPMVTARAISRFVAQHKMAGASTRP